MIFQLVITPQRQYSSGMKKFSLTGPQPTLIGLLSHLSIGVVIEQFIHERNDLRSSTPPTSERDRQCLGCSSFEPDMSSNFLIYEQQGDIFEKQADHAFAIPISR